MYEFVEFIKRTTLWDFLSTGFRLNEIQRLESISQGTRRANVMNARKLDVFYGFGMVIDLRW